MNKTNNTSRSSFDEYVSSFCNAFELQKDGESSLSSCSLNTVSMDNDDYVSDYLDCAYIFSKRPMQKSLSWSSTDPSIACERDSYLMPYACQDYKQAAPRYQRPRSITLSPKSSPKYLCVDKRNNPFSNYSNTSSTNQMYSSLSSNSSENMNSPLSPISPLANLRSIKEAPSSLASNNTIGSEESAYSSQDEIELIQCDLNEDEHRHQQQRKDSGDMRFFMQPRRARSNTAPPNISITCEDGHSKCILDVLTENVNNNNDAKKNQFD